MLLAAFSKPDFIKMGKTHLRALTSPFRPLAELMLFTHGLDKTFPAESGNKEPQSACRDTPNAENSRIVFTASQGFVLKDRVTVSI